MDYWGQSCGVINLYKIINDKIRTTAKVDTDDIESIKGIRRMLDERWPRIL